MGRVRALVCALALFLAMTASPADARLPPAYGATVVSAPPAAEVRVFDLRPAIEVAQRSGKPILLYFGAFDCPFCKQLDRLFAQHGERLAPKLRDKFTLIEVDGWLRGAKMEFVIPEGQFTLPRLRERFGDHEPRFLWPTFYWLDRRLKIFRDIPPGIGVFRDVETVEQLLEL